MEITVNLIPGNAESYLQAVSEDAEWHEDFAVELFRLAGKTHGDEAHTFRTTARMTEKHAKHLRDLERQIEEEFGL